MRLNKTNVAVCVIALVTSGPVLAQSDVEKRVDALEQELKALKKENEEAKKAASQNKAAEWTNRVTLKGDVRYRGEYTDDEALVDDRWRNMLRARLAIEARANDKFLVGIGVSTSENGNPRGANVTLDGEFSRKALDLDLGYFDWNAIAGGHVIGGKMKMPFFRPGQSFFFDNDVNPEGIALTYERGMFFGNGYGFWIEENVPVAGVAPTKADTMMYGGQFGARIPISSMSLTVAAMYYDLAQAQGHRPFFNGLSNGNTTVGPNNVLAYDFQVAELSAELNMKLGAYPLQVWADVAQNFDAELDLAYTVGVLFGKASNPNTWEAGVAYQAIEKDALFAQHIDSDFAGGVSDSDGWIARGGYAVMKNVVINATYFRTRRGVDVPPEFEYDRLLLDFNVKF
jgi:hypothetical protein